MNQSSDLLTQKEWRIIDQSVVGLHANALQSFGMDDALCASVGSGEAPSTMRSWVHPKTVVLGIQDSRLPFLEEGLTFLTEQGYHYIVRNSGGLAVVLDDGVLNLSLLLREGERGIDINSGYDTMLTLIREMFQDMPYDIVAKEIVGSYCPGSYDLSINGRKFAGISQRRLRHGVAVQIYLCVNGSGSERANVIREFYQHAKRNVETKFVYPQINPTVMASLSELFECEMTIDGVMLRVLQVLKTKSQQLYAGSLTPKELQLFEFYYQRVIERNHKIFEK